MNEMRGHSLPGPTFAEVSEMFRVTFQGPGERILDLIPEAGVTDLRALGLNERQVKALAILVNEGRELTNREYRQMFDITYVTAFRDLTELVNTDQARMIGSGRSRRYRA